MFLSYSIVAAVFFGIAAAQDAPPSLPPVALPDHPVVFESAEQPQLRVVVVADQLSHPWGLAFLPGGEILVTERSGQLRVIRDGRLAATPIGAVPAVHAVGLAGLMDVALHPDFAQNGLVYLTYSKPGPDSVRVALARGRLDLDGAVLHDVHDLFLSDALAGNGTAASRVAFAPDGTLFLTVGGAFGSDTGGLRAQDPNDTIGKVLRLNDDGTAPEDNPFFGRAGHRPEVYSLGHRNQLGLTIHPETGAVWMHENGPQGGDEVNLICPGLNYGWPLASYSRQYSGARVVTGPWQDGTELPEIAWLPSVAPSGMVFYDGDRFPGWTGNLFVGSLRTGGIRNTGHLERIVFNDKGEELRRESLLGELRQRIRDVRQGPDGLLYVLTDAENGALLRIEPVE